MMRTLISQSFRKQQQQDRPQALATSLNDVFRDRANERHIRAQMMANHAVAHSWRKVHPVSVLAIGRLRTLARWTRIDEGRGRIWPGDRVAQGDDGAPAACAAIRPVTRRDQAMPACSTTSMTPMLMVSSSSPGNRWSSKMLFIAANPRIRTRVFAAACCDSGDIAKPPAPSGRIGECFRQGSIPA